uniref:hypothetical protein n=1 Tax=Flavobacterium sp. TaxID=239 RepID=UPI004049D71B
MFKKNFEMPCSLLRFSLIISFLLISIDGFSQDKIVKKGGETLEVKILEISPNEIKYQIFSDPTGPIYIMDKDRILEVIFENGRVERYESPLNDSELYIGQKKRAVKMNFISPLLGYTQVAYEQSLKPGRGYELSLGIIGLGQNQESSSGWSGSDFKEDQRGAFGSFGFKFIRIPDFTAKNQKYGHILQGTYVKPEVMVGYFTKNVYSYNLQRTERLKNTYGALLVNVGKQWVFSDIFLVDLYVGLGYAFQNKTHRNVDNYDYNGRLYGIIAGDSATTFAMSGGFRIGILLD